MRAALKLIRLALAALLLAFVGYEVFAVWRAEQRTPAVLAEAAKGPIRLSDVPKRRIDMLLKVEDPDFYRHHGLDSSTPGAGMTTITQSLVKRFYFAHFRKGFAKIEQSLIAYFILDPAMTKDAQLQAYFNFSGFGTYQGRQVTGFADAAQVYFGRDFNRLDDRQYLSLVAMLMAPNMLDPVRHRAANDERVRRIQAMLAGACKPAGYRDVTYQGCAGAS